MFDRKGSLFVLRQYPHMRFKRHWEITPDVSYLLGECHAIITAISEMPLRPEYYGELLNVSLIKGAQATTAIEGNTLTDEEVSKVARGGTLPPSKEYQEKEVKNILDAMNLVFGQVASEGHDQIISPELLRRFHQLIGKDLGKHFDAIPGRFREDERTVGPYRCPSYRDVPHLVDRLCAWLQAEFRYEPGAQSFTQAVIEAIVAHVYIEWIHPFGDGNGRAGRLVEFYVLLRAGNPNIASHILSNFYNLTRPEYYRQLDNAGKTRDLTEFIAYAVTGFRDGLNETLDLIQKAQFETAWRSYIYDKFAARQYRKTVFKRRRELVLRMPFDHYYDSEEIPTISAEVALAYAGLSNRTIVRDLHVLMEMGLLVARNNKYAANTNALRQQMPRRRNDIINTKGEEKGGGHGRKK